MTYDCIVAGAGPAGLMAALIAARAGKKTIVFEQNARPGAKILVSGGGRCNFTNTLGVDEFWPRLGRQGRFMAQALGVFGPEAIIEFFKSCGVEHMSPDTFHVYPASEKAADILGALVTACTRAGVEIRTHTKIDTLVIEAGIVTGVASGSTFFKAKNVVVATGSMARPDLGGNESGYTLCRQAGHAIKTPLPALVPLKTEEPWVASCAGASFEHARVAIDLPKYRAFAATGPLLFTHQGLSGPAVLDISGSVAEAIERLGKVLLTIDFFPETSREMWLNRFDGWYERLPRKTVLNLLADHMPRSFAQFLCSQAGCTPETTAAHLTSQARRTFCSQLTGCFFTVCGTSGFDGAMVARGGVALAGVDPESFASKKTPGLHIAGEVLDIDGPCGGFNLTCAFASGYCAGLSIAK
ncbi:MAG: hypothetical protein A2487_19145 [Candidatus Raymondbacteria bacterium RifOxyC12_full_50_8]|uniref:Flavoprotein n=1 Tax=Candidatus Raymondbacteria bacterium RIFOXYD12_FULL_49_13 TaxID=1817890 RepID=A0A1F7FF94_UNCRA|nr:MAG: hypothetical protein A2248_22630 [Candidatus Raymondbacteria bacterium RIFOXYA2_FULL_49_16]OGK01017.1 MAG: hypothetical protein A2350_11605 [Candidatus Raymondbacteria bacterium RifOxyB12_full_50_8]OGK03369.1 MAG: hypothetical protein A2487_19145 [Candidatus Raymondbacteria bacterium RifOxyC12_full_50_8]OGK05365.1 MAG: hypothetical protein A2519_03580 [Candidatus Raymondbacteria bacterium RIFOXYD12_FULL_49_13]OGP42978.1 MAG: hypothetical protein A2324_16285 [Candidatus Raymondbacteria b